MHWSDEYPHDIWASVLLNKKREILDWKVSYYRTEMGLWNIKNNHAYDNQHSTEHAVFSCKDDKEHELAFNDWSQGFFKGYKIADGFKGSHPY